MILDKYHHSHLGDVLHWIVILLLYYHHLLLVDILHRSYYVVYYYDISVLVDILLLQYCSIIILNKWIWNKHFKLKCNFIIQCYWLYTKWLNTTPLSASRSESVVFWIIMLLFCPHYPKQKFLVITLYYVLDSLHQV